MPAMSKVTLTFSGPRADLQLQRPEKLNAMDLDVFDALADALEEVAASDARVLVVSGAGRSFSAGIDVATFGSVGGAPADMIARAQAGFRALYALPIPTVAAVQGHALGAGLQLALACDLRIAAADAIVGLLEINYGLIPDLGGATRLPQLIGPARAKELIWLARSIDAAAALSWGVVNQVVPAQELDASVDAVVTTLLSAPATAVAEAKALIERAHLVAQDAGMDAEAAAQERCMTSPDFATALVAGLQRRSRG